jgi:hypothetical protein
MLDLLAEDSSDAAPDGTLAVVPLPEVDTTLDVTKPVSTRPRRPRRTSQPEPSADEQKKKRRRLRWVSSFDEDTGTLAPAAEEVPATDLTDADPNGCAQTAVEPNGFVRSFTPLVDPGNSFSGPPLTGKPWSTDTDIEWLAVQIWIFRRISIKRTKSNSYRKHFYNCVKMEHIGLHSVGTYHKKFGWKKKKNKNVLCRVSKNDTRQSMLCRVQKKTSLPGANIRRSVKITTVSYRRLLTALYWAPSFTECLALDKDFFAKCISVPRVLFSVNAVITESRSLPIKNTQQSVEQSAKSRILVVKRGHAWLSMVGLDRLTTSVG